MAEEHVAPLQKIRDQLLKHRRDAASEVVETLEESGYLFDQGMKRLVDAHRLMAVLDEMIASEQPPRKPNYNIKSLA